MLKSLHSLGSCAENFPLIQISSILSVIFTRLWLKGQRMFWWASCTSARHAGSFDCLMTSLILITMDNGRVHCAYWQSCKVPNQTHRGMKKIRKMYAIKQIKICAEYRDMLLRPRLDLSGTPGLRPVGLSPGSWQTSLGLGSMSRYSAQILICIALATPGGACLAAVFCWSCRETVCYCTRLAGHLATVAASATHGSQRHKTMPGQSHHGINSYKGRHKQRNRSKRFPIYRLRRLTRLHRNRRRHTQ